MPTRIDESVSATSMANALEHRQLSVWKTPEFQWQPIPVALTPLIVEQADWNQLVHDARLVLNVFPRLLKWLQAEEQNGLHKAIFAQLKGIESWATHQNPDEFWNHCTIRFDLFWDQDDLKIIEANCTIPAMQSYSDIVLDAWQEARGVQLIPATSNSRDLLESLLSQYQPIAGSKSLPNILMLHRLGDSQLAELEYHQQKWSDRANVILATPEVCKFDSNGRLFVQDQRVDLVYRHIFAWRLEPFQEWVSAMKSSRANNIFNPVSAHYESKAFFALVSLLSNERKMADNLGLSAEELTAIQKRVPWTRILPSRHLKHKTELESGFSRSDLVENIERYVFKNSLGYGGHQVYLGSHWYEPSSQNRLKRLLNSEAQITPEAFLRWVEVNSDDTWIVQHRMTGRKYASRFLNSRRQEEEIDGYIDASVFLNSGTKVCCGGGVSRFAAGPIVNIGGGGGLVPFIVR